MSNGNKWDLSIDVDVAGNVVTVGCRRTRSASPWTDPKLFEKVVLKLDALEDDVKKALGFLPPSDQL